MVNIYDFIFQVLLSEVFQLTLTSKKMKLKKKTNIKTA